MAIKPISKLDPYQNGAGDFVGNVGGNIHLYEVQNTDDLIAKLTDPYSHKQSRPTGDQVDIAFEENDFYNLLFEVSKPIDAGKDGLNSNEYSSYKLTYEDLIQNIIVDTKQWLNARNNLGDFDLCAIVNRNYTFNGDKTFANNVNINQSLNVTGNTNITGAVTITGDTHLKANLYVSNSISCGNDLRIYNNIYARGALYTGTLSSDANGTTITLGRDGFVVQGVLTGHANPNGYLNVGVPTNITGNTSITGSLTATNGLTVNAGGIHVTGNSTFDNDITVNGVANLTAEHAKWSDLAEYYLGDEKYEPGTLVVFGGKNEITIANGTDGEVNGVVTSKPAFLMNSGLKDNPLGCAIALAGRVPVKIKGKVKKFDCIVLSDQDGVGIAIDKSDGRPRKDEIIGRALEASDYENVKLVECVVKFRI